MLTHCLLVGLAQAQVLDTSWLARPIPARPVAATNPWSQVGRPTSGASEAIGTYSAGCLRGARALAQAPGLQIMRPSRNRFYGHPALIRYLSGLGAAARSLGGGDILVGDLAQARGGPALPAHASHQLGLDVDIWFKTSDRELSDAERESLGAPRMVVPDFEGTTPSWTPRIVDVLRLAAEPAAVERIFVNPVVKREACKASAGQAWVGKLRPLWGHDDHFHVRLECPDASPKCRPQEAAPPGDGCGEELASWFTPEMRREARRRRLHPTPTPFPTLPDECAAVLREP